MLQLRSGNDYEVQEKSAAPGHIRIWLFASGILGLLFVACAIFYVWLYIQQVQNGYKISKLCEQNELHSTVQRKLRLEWSRLRDPNRLEEIGRNQFGLGPPRPDQKIVLR